MRASRHPQLGRVVASYNRAVSELLDDPMNGYAGFTPDPTPELQRLVQREGFANLRHFYAVVARRTSERFVFFNLEA